MGIDRLSDLTVPIEWPRVSPRESFEDGFSQVDAISQREAVDSRSASVAGSPDSPSHRKRFASNGSWRFMQSFRRKEKKPLFASRKVDPAFKQKAYTELVLNVYNRWTEDLAKQLGTHQLASHALKRINVLRKTGARPKLGGSSGVSDSVSEAQTLKMSRTLARLGRMCRHSRPENW